MASDQSPQFMTLIKVQSNVLEQEISVCFRFNFIYISFHFNQKSILSTVRSSRCGSCLWAMRCFRFDVLTDVRLPCCWLCIVAGAFDCTFSCRFLLLFRVISRLFRCISFVNVAGAECISCEPSMLWISSAIQVVFVVHTCEVRDRCFVGNCAGFWSFSCEFSSRSCVLSFLFRFVVRFVVRSSAIWRSMHIPMSCGLCDIWSQTHDMGPCVDAANQPTFGARTYRPPMKR